MVGGQSRARTGIMVRCFGAATSVSHRRVDRGVRMRREVWNIHQELLEMQCGIWLSRGAVVVSTQLLPHAGRHQQRRRAGRGSRLDRRCKRSEIKRGRCVREVLAWCWLGAAAASSTTHAAPPSWDALEWHEVHVWRMDKSSGRQSLASRPDACLLRVYCLLSPG